MDILNAGLELPSRSKSWDVDNRGHYQQDLAVSGIKVEISRNDLAHMAPTGTTSTANSAGVKIAHSINKHDLAASCPSIDVQLVESPAPVLPYLNIGTGETTASQVPTVCASPSSTDENLYDTAYQESVQATRQEHDRTPVIFPNSTLEKI